MLMINAAAAKLDDMDLRLFLIREAEKLVESDDKLKRIITEAIANRRLEGDVD